MEEVKHDIRNVLVSCKVPLTIKELSEQYKYLTGRPIEFAAFGYPDLECFIMDMPDVLDTVWAEGEVRLVCKRDLTDVTIEALINVLRHSKSSGGFVGSSKPKDNPEIFIPRLWQDTVENIIKTNNNSMQIAALEKEIERMQLRLSEKRFKLCGVLKRCFNFIVSEDKTIVSIRNERDILIELVQKILEDNSQGIDLDKLEIILQKKFKKPFSFKKFGFENAFQFFKYYSKYLTFLIEKDGHIKLFSKKRNLIFNRSL